MLSLNRPRPISASIAPSAGRNAGPPLNACKGAIPAQFPSVSSRKAPIAVCTLRVKAMCAFSCEPSSLPRFQCPLVPMLGVEHGLELAGHLVAMILQRCAVHPHHVALGDAGLLETDVGVRNVRARKAGNGHLGLGAALRDVLDHAEIQGLAEAGRYAGRFQAHLQPVHAHVALAHLPLDRVELRRVVGAHPGAVAAAEADVRVLQHRAVFRELGVGAGRATLQADRVVAMVAGHRDVDALASLGRYRPRQSPPSGRRGAPGWRSFPNRPTSQAWQAMQLSALK